MARQRSKRTGRGALVAVREVVGRTRFAQGAGRAASRLVEADGETGAASLFVDSCHDGGCNGFGYHEVLFHRRDNDLPNLGEVSVEMFPTQQANDGISFGVATVSLSQRPLASGVAHEGQVPLTQLVVEDPRGQALRQSFQ